MTTLTSVLNSRIDEALASSKPTIQVDLEKTFNEISTRKGTFANFVNYVHHLFPEAGYHVHHHTVSIV